MRIVKEIAYVLTLQAILIHIQAFTDGSRGSADRRKNRLLNVRGLKRNGSTIQAIEETAAHEVIDTFATTKDKLPKIPGQVKEQESGVAKGGRDSEKKKSRKGKLPERHFAPKAASTKSPAGRLPTAPVMPPSQETKKYPVIKTPAKKDQGKDYSKKSSYKKESQDKGDTGATKAPKRVKGEKDYEDTEKKDKISDDRAKYPKGTKDGKEKGDKTKVPKFPGDDDIYDHVGGDEGSGGTDNEGTGSETDSTATRAPRIQPTMAPTEPKDGRNEGDEVQNAAERDGDEEDEYDDGFGDGEDNDDGNIPILPDYRGGGDEDNDNISRLVDIAVPVASAAAVMVCCLAVFCFRRRRKDRSPQDIYEIDAKIHSAEEGTYDGTADLTDARTFTFSESGIEKHKRMISMAQRSDRSSTVDEELHRAMESLEDFEEVSLHDDDVNHSRRSSPSGQKTTLTDHIFGSTFRPPALPSKRRALTITPPAIEEAVSRDDSSTSDIYVTNQGTYEESDNEYESGSEASSEKEEVHEEIHDQDEVLNQDENLTGNKIDLDEKTTDPPVKGDEEQIEQKSETNLIDLTTYDQEVALSSPDDHIVSTNTVLLEKKKLPEKEDPPIDCARLESSEPHPIYHQEVENKVETNGRVSDINVPHITSTSNDTNKVDEDSKPEWMKKAEERMAAASNKPLSSQTATENTHEDHQPAVAKKADEKMFDSAPTPSSDSGNQVIRKEDTRPVWMKTTLRSASPSPPSSPKKKEEEDVPEWMRKYKQMKFQKADN